jgi:hypothetical protein
MNLLMNAREMKSSYANRSYQVEVKGRSRLYSVLTVDTWYSGSEIVLAYRPRKMAFETMLELRSLLALEVRMGRSSYLWTVRAAGRSCMTRTVWALFWTTRPKGPCVHEAQADKKLARPCFVQRIVFLCFA